MKNRQGIDSDRLTEDNADWQGRLPIRVELQALSQDDFFRILTETKHNLPQQYVALMRTEGVEIIFEENGLQEIAAVCYELNQTVQNIGARRLR